MLINGHEIFGVGPSGSRSANVPLYTKSSTSINSNRSLATWGRLTTSSSGTLFLSGTVPATSGSSSRTLFIKANLSTNSNAPLVVKSKIAGSGVTTLFVTTGAPTSKTANTTLFLATKANQTSNATLFENGNLNLTKTATLVMPTTKASASGSPTLYTKASTGINSNTTLAVAGRGFTSSSTNLYERGRVPTSTTMPLVVATAIQPTGIFSSTLAIYGSSQSGVLKGFPLFVVANPGDNSRKVTMPLFVKSPNTTSSATNMNLYTGGGQKNSAKSTTLFVQNNQSGVTLSAPMFIQGNGTSAGAYPVGGSMNLTIKRYPGAATTLFLKAPGQTMTSGVPFSMFSAISVFKNAPLSIPHSIGSGIGNVPLIVRGY